MPPQNRVGLNHAGQSDQGWPEPRHPADENPVTITQLQAVWRAPKRNIELVPKKKVLDFELPPRLEQAGDERPEQMEDGKHHAGSCYDSP
jgi:hypothetical protein